MLKDYKGKKVDEKFVFLKEKLVQITKCPDQQKSVLSRTLQLFKSDYKKRWIDASYKHESFLKNNEQWLTSTIKLPYSSVKTTERVGRPSKLFEELSNCSKRQKTRDLREKVPVEELTYAASVSQRTSGNADVAKIITEITSTPTRATKFRKIIASAHKEAVVKKFTPQEALVIFIEGDFTRRQWEVIQSASKSIYPCYSLIKKAKQDCYPHEDSMRVTETCAEIKLQALLDHTALRLFKYVEDVIVTCTEIEKRNMVLISKWGCDGSQQTQYKQKFHNRTDSDANIFQSSLVPLRIVVIIDGEKKKIVWQNPVPSSPRFCRPIRIRFINESKNVTQEEIAYIETQAQNLVETCTPNGKIKHSLLFTMIDGKVCNAATDTASTMRCYICGQTSKDFNKFAKAEAVNEEAMKFGLSILHARIRFFESLLHLAYKLPIKKWQARSAEDKAIVKETKEKIQREFREEMGLLVDIPKAGFGNTNDGNTSRRFFDDPECSSVITGINIELIKRFKVILEVISSVKSTDPLKFNAYAEETAKMYIQLYGWHPMTPTVHKVLMHGAQVISHAILPIGQLSEEAAEARNKHFRQYRLNFGRKFSRVDCNRDVLNRLLLSSDPYISSCRPRQHNKTKPFSQEALNLMRASTPPLQDDEDEGEPLTDR